MAHWLEQFGLTETEAMVYTTLLKHGACTAGKVARVTKQHPRTVYDAVERLMQKGLLGAVRRNNRKHYLALNPKTLQEFIAEQELAVMQLALLIKNPEPECKVHLFYGKTGLRQGLEDPLQERAPITNMNPGP